MKMLVLFDNDDAATELTGRIQDWVDYENHCWYHGAIDIVTPAAKYYGWAQMIPAKREKVRIETMKMRRVADSGIRVR